MYVSPMLPLVLVAPLAISVSQAVDRAALAPVVEAVLTESETPGTVVALVRGSDVILLEAFGLSDVGSKRPMRADELFQIGSCTKTFTAALLTQAAAKGELGLDDPLGQWLDPARELPEWVHDVTLRQIATHTSGLPRDATNRRNVPGAPSVAEPYSIDELYAGLGATQTSGAPGARWSYSNLGYGLLGHALENATGKKYEVLLRERVLAPLGMNDSGVTPTPEQEARLAPGYWDGDFELVPRARWVFGDVCANGGIFSSARDLARYVSALLAKGDAGPFSDATRAVLFTPVADIQPGRRMAPGWFVDTFPGVGEVVGHGGEVDSYSSALALIRDANLGLIVLANRGGDSAELLSRALLTKALPKLLPAPR